MAVNGATTNSTFCDVFRSLFGRGRLVALVCAVLCVGIVVFTVRWVTDTVPNYSDGVSSAAWQGCRGEAGQAVDSFIVYKLPEDQNSKHSFIRQGLGYTFLYPDTSLTQDLGEEEIVDWTLSNLSIASERSLVGRTLSIFYQNTEPSNSLYFMYNDESPDGTTSESHGHTKGVVFMSASGGFWLSHSTPHFPPTPAANLTHLSALYPDHRGHETDTPGTDRSSKYDYPATGTRFGQTFLCLSLSPDQGEQLGYQLLLYKPFIYTSNVPDSVATLFPSLSAVVKGDKPPSKLRQRVAELRSAGGGTVISFAKYSNFGQDLYDALVAPELKSNLYVESWRNGPQPLPSNCSAQLYKVENVRVVKSKETGSVFSTHQDHSKWAVSADLQQSFLCVGDINRMRSQFHRAGGTVCLRSNRTAEKFRNLIVSAENC